MRVTASDANTELLELIEAAERGEEVIVTGKSGTAFKLVPVEVPRFISGILKGKVPPGGPDFLEPMSEEELRDWQSNAPA